MKIFNVKVNREKKGIVKLDSRTILLLILFSNAVIFFSTMIEYEFILMCGIFLLCIVCGEYKSSVKMFVIFLSIMLFDYVISHYLCNTWLVFLTAGFRFIRRVIPTGTLGMLLIQTNRVSEIMESLSKMRCPKSVTIPLTVLLRYFPSVGEDRAAIKKAMAMRGLRGGFFRHPIRSIECMYVPIMMAASRRADELSCAAVTRGIENPKKRTMLVETRFAIPDVICSLVALGFTILSLNGGGL